jgi:DNA repair exonuclease SbcCD ATPase subunit
MPRSRFQLADVAADLYGLALDEFTAQRNAAAAELRKQGLRDEAEQVKALEKPTKAAWAVNQLARTKSADLDAFLKAARALRDAQLRGRGDVQSATRAERGALNKLVSAAEEMLGRGAAKAVIAGVRQTLETAAVDDDAAAELRRGRLVRELEPAGFGSLLSHAPARPRPTARSEPTPKRDDAALRQAREQLRRAEDQLREAEAEHDRAREILEEAERSVDLARRECEQARARAGETGLS